jgi:hypothetical protein
MKKIILLCFLQILFSQYFIEEYNFTWEYDRTGDIVVRVVKTPLSTSIDVCKDSYYNRGCGGCDDCIKMGVKDAIIFSDILSKANLYYTKFKNIEQDVEESINFKHHSYDEEVKFEKTLDKGFQIRLTSNSGSWFYITRKEANYISNSLKDSEQIFEFLNKKVAPYLD